MTGRVAGLGAMRKQRGPLRRRAPGPRTAALLIGLAACAGASPILEVRLAGISDPQSGQAFRIQRVSDRRFFQPVSRDPRLPSAQGGLPDAALAQRIVARRGSGGDRSGGDLLLPEGTSVEDLVAEALTTGFREAGYRVLAPGAPGHAAALPIEADIEQLWGWMRRRATAEAIFDFEVRVRVRAPVAPFAEGVRLRGESQLTRGGPSNASWERLIEDGMADLAASVRGQLTGGGSVGLPERVLEESFAFLLEREPTRPADERARRPVPQCRPPSTQRVSTRSRPRKSHRQPGWLPIQPTACTCPSSIRKPVSQ